MPALSLNLYVVSFLLALVQGLAALPWLIVLNLDAIRSRKQPATAATWARWLGLGLLGVATIGAGVMMLILSGRVKESLQLFGGIYGFILHTQLVADFFIL